MSTVRDWIGSAHHIAVLTGAGMSAESGVPTFRDAQTGLWAQFKPEDLATEDAFRAHPRRVWDWYQFRRDMIAQVAPNAGHRALAAFQQRHPGRLTLITQNVDGLHQRAGSTDAIALHGNLADDRWLDVVWFGEMLPLPALDAAQKAANGCNLMLVVGTSGVVYPAAGLAHTAHRRGARVVVINPEATELDVVADLCLHEPAAQCLPTLLED